MVKRIAKSSSVEVQSAIAEARENAHAIFMKIEKETIVGLYTLPKKPGKDGYYRVYVKDTSKKSGRRQLFAKGLEELADEIYNYEKGLNGKTRKTFGELFKLIEDQKLQRTGNPNKLTSVQNTINRHWGTYNKFFRGTEFEKRYIDEITKGDIYYN